MSEDEHRINNMLSLWRKCDKRNLFQRYLQLYKIHFFA